uniref:Prosaposin n=1 Tax=Neogobius melanostomus TaxID=47308 RepID=A0A8C6V6G8_9GOBI
MTCCFSAVASPLLGTEQCARGPPYWCQNVKTASLCGAVPHCQQNVWNKPQLKTVPCDLCKEIIIVVEQILKDNATESEILGYMEKACQLIPDESLTAECKEMVDSYYPILIGIITGELDDPDVVCGAMGLCRSEEAALAQVEQIQSNEIPKVDLSQVASPFMLNIPQLLFPQELTKEEEPKKDNDEVCDDCVKFLKAAQDKIKKDAGFVNQVIAQIEAQCDQLGPGLSDMCKQYVSQYAPMIVEQFKNADPKDLCCKVGFCPAMKKSVPMLSLLPALAKPAAESFPAFQLVPATKVEAAKRMVRVRDSPQCAVCEFVMKQLEDTLGDQTTEQEVIDAVEKVCTFLPSSLRGQCKDLIDTYGKAIIELLVQEADPKTVCTVLGLCTDSSRHYVAALDEARFKAGGFCEVCKLAVNYVDGILEQNATEAQIEEAVKKVCNFLPKAYQTECDQLIEQYEPTLVQLLLQMMDPDFVCMKMGACPGAVKRLLGTEQCSWGPSFWCKSMETATRCNAVEHCKRHVW